MKISLHIGPHKTGTTTAQKALRRGIGSFLPRPTWYPIFRDRNHNHIVRDFIKRVSEADLRKIVTRAQNKGVEHLILSAEAFCVAGRDDLDRVADLVDGHELHLLATLNSPLRRASSLWQEHVKHRHEQSFEENPSAVLKHASFAPDLIPTFVRCLGAACTTIIITRRSDAPDVLTRNLWRALGLSDPIPQLERPSNAGLGLIETEMWRRLNVLLAGAEPPVSDAAYASLRLTLAALFSSGEWRAACPFVKIETPETVRAELQRIAERTVEEVRSMVLREDVVVLGPVSALLEG